MDFAFPLSPRVDTAQQLLRCFSGQNAWRFMIFLDPKQGAGRIPPAYLSMTVSSESPMRVLVWSIVACATILSIPAKAQTYDPRVPVCMKVYDGSLGGGEWIDCSYMSLPQCQASASGRAAMCVINPYFAQPPSRTARPHRRHRHAD